MTHRGLTTFLALVWLTWPAAPAGAQLAGTTIRIGVGGPLTGGAATFGVEMKQAVELAVEEKNAAGGILGATVVAVTVDDEASTEKGQAIARRLCDDPVVLGVVGHVNSNVSIAASTIYDACGLAMVATLHT